MLIGMSLMILIILALLNILFGASFSDLSVRNNFIGTLGTNSSSTEVSLPKVETSFFIDPVSGAIVMLVILATISAVVSVQVLGSGLNETGTKNVTASIFYIGIWSVFSVLSYGLISSIKIFGVMIYISLTIMYVVGVGQKLNSY